MRAVIQRTNHANVVIDGKLHSGIQVGMLILVGISRHDSEIQADYLARRIPKLRIFDDIAGKMNLDIRQVGGSFLVVPDFTLYGDCRKGRRPRFDDAMPPLQARCLCDYLIEKLRETGIRVETGVFGANMQVTLLNSGPVTVILESP